MTDRYLNLLKQCLTASIYPESANLLVRPIAGRGRIRNRVLREVEQRGYTVHKRQEFDSERRSTGSDWPSIGYSMIGLKRMDNVQECVESVIADKIPGDIVECGVWRGGAVILMLATLQVRGVTDRVVWAADSYEGLPAPSNDVDEGYDLSGDPYLAVSLEQVQSNIAQFGLLDESRVEFLKGWFSDTLPTAPIESISVLRLDGDLYESTMDVLNSLYAKVTPGGYVIVDDYHSWEPCRRAISEYRETHGITDTIQEIDGAGVFWRVT